jgi:hypothetical protein
MTMRVRTGLLMLIAALAMMGLASCGHYTCGANFGVSTCASGTVSLSGGGGGSTAAAFVYLINGSGSPGSMISYTLNTNAIPPTLTATSSYIAPATPPIDAGIGLAVAQKQFLYAAFDRHYRKFDVSAKQSNYRVATNQVQRDGIRHAKGDHEPGWHAAVRR